MPSWRANRIASVHVFLRYLIKKKKRLIKNRISDYLQKNWIFDQQASVNVFYEYVLTRRCPPIFRLVMDQSWSLQTCLKSLDKWTGRTWIRSIDLMIPQTLLEQRRGRSYTGPWTLRRPPRILCRLWIFSRYKMGRVYRIAQIRRCTLSCWHRSSVLMMEGSPTFLKRFR